MSDSADPGIRDCLDTLMAAGRQTISMQELGQVVEEVLSTLQGELVLVGRQPDGTTTQEPAAGGTALATAVADALSPLNEGGGESPFTRIAEELDSVVSVAKTAADGLLSATELLENEIETEGNVDPGIVSDAVTAIYEACGFQDITGQRITRITQLLREIEFHIADARTALGDTQAEKRKSDLGAAIEQEDARSMEHILHGPQDAGIANNQEEIDKILASFD